MDEGIFLTGAIILPIFTILWLSTFFGTLIGCSKKKQGPVKKVGDSAASAAASPGPIPGKSPASANVPPAGGGGGNVGAGGKPITSQDANNNKTPNDGKNAAENKEVSNFKIKFNFIQSIHKIMDIVLG